MQMKYILRKMEKGNNIQKEKIMNKCLMKLNFIIINVGQGCVNNVEITMQQSK